MRIGHVCATHRNRAARDSLLPGGYATDAMRPEMRGRISMKSPILVIVILTATLVSVRTFSSGSTCEPAFTAIQSNRSLPSVFVDQGLESIPHLYPRHLLLVARRHSEIGAVRYSLLVYKQDSKVELVTIEGVAVHKLDAWQFSTTCSSETAFNGLVETMERLSSLAKK